MASKPKTRYRCSSCGNTQLKWAGQCGQCGEWNTLEEEIAREPRKNDRFAGYAGSAEVVRLDQIDQSETPRISSGLSELDRVLGGGIVPGSVTLIGGDPGIGKSTLLMQTSSRLAHIPVLYVSGEESPRQIGLRANRLGLAVDHLQLLTETSVEQIIALTRHRKPEVMVIDSIQTLFTETLQSAPGAVGQVRESTAQLVRMAKQEQISMFIVGHVTKDGQLAGPRVLEHMVDTVLYFEGDPSGRYRVLRAIKNRFGAVNELGIFAMTESGLKPVNNPSAIFLSRHEQPVAGSVIMATREGSRPLLVEVQALVAASHGGAPRRVAVGLEQNRLAMLLAVLQRHGGVLLHDQDVFINVVGGVRVGETAADLPLLLAAVSSFRDRPFPGNVVTFGEIGLAGEIRPVSHGEDRLREAARQGFTRAVIPRANAPRKPIEGLKVTPVSRLAEVMDLDF